MNGVRVMALGVVLGTVWPGVGVWGGEGPTVGKGTVRVRWIGHAYFTLTDSAGRTV